MRHLPLRSISISDFRRLEGSRRLPLDAPIVLLHGPNGTGKTSVLSALELALTGEIRSMRRQDDRYTAHLPSHGQPFATVGVEIADSDGAITRPGLMTVGGSRVEGLPALRSEVAQFYAERSYLDQVSLGQLLELYQYREGKEESALARFVNELLGLDQLDALRAGLSDATDVRRLKNLSERYAQAENNADHSAVSLEVATTGLGTIEGELARVEVQLKHAALGLGYAITGTDLSVVVGEIEGLLAKERVDVAHREALRLSRALTALGGRIQGLVSRPAMVRLEDARAAAVAAAHAYQAWREIHEEPIAALRRDVAELQLASEGELSRPLLDDELARIDTRLARHEAHLGDVSTTSRRIGDLRLTLDRIQGDIAQAEGRAGSLAAGLAALREQVTDDICPVCDRDYTELATGHLGEHVDAKIAQLTDQGQKLRALTQERDNFMRQLQESEREFATFSAGVLTEIQLDAAETRRQSILSLRSRFDDLSPAIADGSALQRSDERAERDLADLEAAEQERQAVGVELADHASALGVPSPAAEESMEDAYARLSEAATVSAARLAAREADCADLRGLLDQVSERRHRIAELTSTVTEAARTKLLWEKRVNEVKRRRAVARAVHNAASDTRAAIVQRVFTESLNDVWRDVFSRLAPREPFVPAFGIPTSTKTALELRLETVHPSGDTGGPPSLMLSAGNLNTAALSLFIALHLAVEPLLPCLVFDDPVQSMDEVHIAQFAALLRVLSKQHERQIIVAVHERELFEYLMLELSPAYPGDELITIELGRASGIDDDDGVNRLKWSPDPAIAVNESSPPSAAQAL